MTKNIVLIVDDDPNIRAYIREVAESESWETEELGSGKDLLSRLKEKPGISLILLDVLMPGKDGIETINELAESESKNISLILMTGGGELNVQNADIIGKMKGLNIIDLLHKPIGMSKLVQIFRRNRIDTD